MNTYRRIENRYIAIGLDKQCYRISEKNHYMIIFGVNIDEDIKGLDLLNSDDREFVIRKGIYGLVNSAGLENRERCIVTKVEKVKHRFKLWTSEGYSWLYPNGSIG